MSEQVAPPVQPEVKEQVPPPKPPNNGHGKPKPAKPKSRPAAPPPKAKASKVLATDRINVVNQLEIVRAYAVISGPENRAVTNEQAAKLVQMQASTVAMTNPFFTALGFLQKTEFGFIPSPEVLAYDRAIQWNSDRPGVKLAPLIERSWFMQVLLPRLRFQNVMDDREVLELLASESSAGPHHRKQLLILLDYAVAVGLVEREGGTVKLVQTTGPGSPPSPLESPQRSATSVEAPVTGSLPTHNSPLASALFPTSANGAVQFNISVHVNMAELAGWTPDRIASFFSGIAQVLAARGKTEQGGI